MDRDLEIKKLAALFDRLAELVSRGEGLSPWAIFTRKEKESYLKNPDKYRERLNKFLFGMGSITDLAIIPKPRSGDTRKGLEASVADIAEKLWAEAVRLSITSPQ